MSKRLFALFLAAGGLFPAVPATAGAPFSCRRLETVTFLPEFPTISGYRWIECVNLGMEAAEVETVSVNNGNCATFDNWYAGRVFPVGAIINIPYACMSPVTVAIAANGVIAKMRLR